MTEFESMLEAFLAQRRNLSRQSVLDMIQKKKEKIGAGYLTDQGALFLIASDLGMSPYWYQETEKNDISRNEKIGNILRPKKKENRQSSSIDKNSLTLSKPTDVKTSFDNLSSQLDKTKKQQRFGLKLAVGSTIGTFILIVSLSKDYPIFAGVVAGLAMVFIMLSMYFLDKGSRRIFDKRQKIFYEFFNVYFALKTYIGIESKKSEKEKKTAIEAIERFSTYIKNWVNDRSPDDISKLPLSISEKLLEKVLPLITQNKVDELTKLRDFLNNISLFVYEKDPSNEQLLELEKLLINLEKVEPIEIHKKIAFFENYPNSKYLLAGIIAGIVSFPILNLSTLGWGGAIVGSSGIAIGVMTVSIMMYKNKKTN